jgi:5'-nucleotidase
VQRGFISVTPIHVDLTRFQALEKVSSWIEELSAGVTRDRSAAPEVV